MSRGNAGTRSRLFMACAAGLLLGAVNASSGQVFQAGEPLDVQYLYPTQSTVYQNFNIVVGPGNEVTGAGGPTNLAILGNKITATFSYNSVWASASYNGFRVFDSTGKLPAFTSVTIDPASNYPGVTLSDITFNADNIYVNWEGLPISTAYTLILDVGGGNIIQNSGPVFLPTTSNIVIYGAATTGTATQSNTINSLTFTPGGSLTIFNTLHVTSNYTQVADSTLTMQFTKNGHSMLTIGGTAQLAGTLNLLEMGNPGINHVETFLTATDGIFGKFSSVIDNFPVDTILDPTIIYGKNSVSLEASFGLFAENHGLTPNQIAVAKALDIASADPNARSLFKYLDYRPLEKLPGDFDRISPEQYTSIFTMSTALDQVQSLNLQRRTDDIRSGSSGFSAAGLAINGGGPSYSGAFDITTGVAGPNGDDGKDVKESKEMKEVAPTENRWGAFLSGTGEWISVGDSNNTRGYELESGGFTLGIDYKVTPHLAIGLMGGYTGMTADLAQGGRMYVNGGKIGLYGTTFAGGWYADVAATGGYSTYDMHRPALQGTATGQTDGGDLNVLFGTGYDFKMGGLTFGPTATFNYTYTGIYGFDERGSLAPLTVHGGDGESLRTAFGVKAHYDWKVGGLLIKPEVRAAWQHEFGDADYHLESNFANGGSDSAFTVEGPRIGRDSLLVGAGFAIQCSERASVYFYYDGDLARQNYEANAVTGGVRIAF